MNFCLSRVYPLNGNTLSASVLWTDRCLTWVFWDLYLKHFLFVTQLDKKVKIFSGLLWATGKDFTLTELFLYFKVCFFPPLSFHYYFTSTQWVKLERKGTFRFPDSFVVWSSLPGVVTHISLRSALSQYFDSKDQALGMCVSAERWGLPLVFASSLSAASCLYPWWPFCPIKPDYVTNPLSLCVIIWQILSENSYICDIVKGNWIPKLSYSPFRFKMTEGINSSLSKAVKHRRTNDWSKTILANMFNKVFLPCSRSLHPGSKTKITPNSTTVRLKLSL